MAWFERPDSAAALDRFSMHVDSDLSGAWGFAPGARAQRAPACSTGHIYPRASDEVTWTLNIIDRVISETQYGMQMIYRHCVVHGGIRIPSRPDGLTP